jgi:hypothetical protein
VTWYADLSPYTHGPGEPGATMRTVGWLEAGRPHPTGPVGTPLAQRVFLSRLDAAAAAPTGPYFAGTHSCGLCPDGTGARGSGEIRVRSAHGSTVLVAPALIAHYVRAHDYRPPDGFVAAVGAGRIEAPAHDPGEELDRYGPDEPLDDGHTAIAVRAVADRAGVFPEAVAARFGFFVSLRRVCERPGAHEPDGAGLPRLLVGLDRSGARSFLTGAGYWDGTAAHLVRLAQASITDHVARQLQEAGWH